MSTSEKFIHTLRDWSEIFMQRSMGDFIRFTKEAGLSMGQLGTLFRLYHEGGCGVSDLGEHLGVTNAAASQMVDRLVQQGFLERSEDPRDRRTKKLALTGKGRDLVCASVEARLRWMDQLTTALTQEEQEAIIQALSLLSLAARRTDSGRSIKKLNC